MAKPWSSTRHLRLRTLLIEERRRSGLSQVELAKLLRRPQSYVSKFETGERKLDVFELIDVTSHLGCDILALIEKLKAQEH